LCYFKATTLYAKCSELIGTKIFTHYVRFVSLTLIHFKEIKIDTTSSNTDITNIYFIMFYYSFYVLKAPRNFDHACWSIDLHFR